MSTVTVEAFNRNIQKHKSHLQVTKSGFLPLYNWQQKAFKLKDYQTVLFNTPTASGKSVLMRAIAADEHINHNRKVIIVVPAQELAKEFEDVEENRLRWQSGNTKIPEFTVTHPLYTEKIQGRIKTVKEFIKSAESGILVACSQTMIGAFDHLNKKYLDNLCVLVDEAHHSSSQSYEDDDESEVLSDEMNELGRVVRKCYENDVVLRFFTATFYRDDRKSVAPKDIMETTKVYDMKLHDFLQDSQLTEVENISCDIRFAKGNSNEKGGHHFALKSIWDANPNKKTAIWLSNPNKFNKVYQTECAIETLGKPIISKAKLKRMGVTDEELEAAQGTVIYLDHKGVLKRVVELSLQSVEECTPKLIKWYRGSVCDRNDRENYFNKVKNDHIDACIYLNKGQEGTNWRALERAVIYEQRKLGRSTQMIGRVLRKWSGKKNVDVHFVLPQMLCTTLNEDAKDKINEYVNTLWASMIIDNIIEPLFLRAKREKNGDGTAVARDQSEFDSVFALRSDEGEYLRNCSELIDQWYEGCDEKPSGREIRKKFGEIVEDQLDSLMIEPNNVQKFVRATWQRLVVKKQEIVGKNPPVIDYDMIMNEDTPVGCAKAFYGTVMTKEFALEYKKFLDGLRGVDTKSMEEHKQLWLENNIKGAKTWGIYYVKENLRELGYLSAPWSKFAVTDKEWTDYVWERNEKEVITKKLIEIIVKNGITETNELKRIIKCNDFPISIDRTNSTGYKSQEFINFCYIGKDWFTEEETIEFLKNKNILSRYRFLSGKYQLTKIELLGHKIPKEKHFWDKLKIEKCYDENEMYKILSERGITNRIEYMEARRNDKDFWKRFPSVPTEKFGKDFWKSLYNVKHQYKTENDHIVFLRNHKIKSQREWSDFRKNTTINVSKFYAVPQSKFGINFWNKVDAKIKYTKKEVKRYILDNPEIINPKTWFIHHSEHTPQGIAKTCWRTFGMTQKEFFDYVFERKTNEDN